MLVILALAIVAGVLVMLRGTITGDATADLCEYHDEIHVLNTSMTTITTIGDGLLEQEVAGPFVCKDGVINIPKTVLEGSLHRCTRTDCKQAIVTRQVTKTLSCKGSADRIVSTKLETVNEPWFNENTIDTTIVTGPLLSAAKTLTYGGMHAAFHDIEEGVYGRFGDAHQEPVIADGWELEGSPGTIRLQGQQEPLAITITALPGLTATHLQVDDVGDSRMLPLPATITLRPDQNLTFSLLKTCNECSASKVHEIIERPSRVAVVLTHGLLTDPSTFADLVSQFDTRSWPWKIYVFSYDFNDNIEKTAAKFAEEINRISGSFDHVILVGHSFGTMVTQAGLEKALTDETMLTGSQAFLPKLESVVLIATPSLGAPILEVYKGLKESTLGNLLTSKLLSANLDPDNERLLSQGKIYPSVPGVHYVAIAGLRSYNIGLGNYDEPNDGVITVNSAQNIGGNILTTPCVDYYSINLTHTELLEHPLAIRMIEQVIARELARPKRQESMQTFAPTTCTPGAGYVVVGRLASPPIAPEACICGDGTCGPTETAEICPSDCASIAAAGPICFAIAPLSMFGFVLILLVALIWAAASYYAARHGSTGGGLIRHLLLILFGTLLTALIGLAIASSQMCGKNITLEILVVSALGGGLLLLGMALRPDENDIDLGKLK